MCVRNIGAMLVKKSRGLVAVAAPVALAAVVLGACGGSDESSTSLTTINLGSTAFVTLPPATTTTTIAGTIEETVAGEQEYTIQAGDFPLRVADLFGVSVEDIGTYNGWAACTSLSCPEFPGPGTAIRIPPGANNLEAVGAPETDTGVETVTGGDAEQPDEPAGDTIPEAGDNCAAGSYTIEEGDFEGRVAEKFDVTVEALRAANASNAEYSIFYPGLQIVIPAKSDC